MKTSFISLIAFCLLLVATHASAAELSFAHDGEVHMNDEFEVRLILDASDAAVNAVEGTFTFSENLEVREIQDSNSFVSLWIERPAIKSGAIHFSGVVPGGYARADAPVFSVIFAAQREGSSVLDARGMRVYLNDGSGTAAVPSVSPSRFVILEEGSPEESARVPRLEDIESPESFSPEIGQSEHLFDNTYFAVFTTQDKLSGIASYAVYESAWNIFWVPDALWKTAESPYVLEDQSLGSFVYVRATDKAGNTRIEILWPRSIGIWNVLYLLLLGLLTLVALYGGILFLKYQGRILRRMK